MDGRARPHSIEIPVKNSNEVVEVFLEDLPEDPSEIKDILVEERTSIELFLQFAVEYYYREQASAFRYLVREGLVECSQRRERSFEISLLTTLAAFNVAVGLKILPFAGKQEGTDTDPAAVNSHFEEATMLLNEAEKHNHLDISLLLRKGVLLLAQNKISQAEYQLKIVTAREPDNVAGHLALGCTAFLGENYATSLEEFQKVLSRLPSSSKDVRLAIGHSFMRLGLYPQAERAFQRVLEIDPKSVASLEALAVINLNRALKSTQSLAQGMQLLKQAYELNRSAPTVLTHLANHFFFKKDFTKANSLADSAVANASGSLDEVKANAQFVCAKIHHAQLRYDEAFRHFSEAIKYNPNHVPAQLGMGQIFLHRGDVGSAVGCFERVVALEKANGREIGDGEFWAMIGLACLCDPAQAAMAEKLMNKALEMGGTAAESFDLFLALASFYETRNYPKAISSFQRARELDSDRFNADPRVLNNYAAILHHSGDGGRGESADREAEAFETFEQALKLSSGELAATIKFNKARLLEDGGKLGDAERLYKEVSREHPNDVQVHLRLGIIASKRGLHTEAAEHYKEAIGIEETSVDAWGLLASNHMRVKALTPARKAFERILKQNDRHDLFSLVALGNIYMEIARHEKKSQAFRESARRALEFYIKALQIQPQNHIAANGVAVVLAELGMYKEAKDIFLQVKQADPTLSEATLNLAHCFVELGQFQAAMHTYEQILQKTKGGSKSAAILLYLGRACYLQAKTQKNIADFEKASGYLEKAAELLPQDAPIKFNIALCQQEVASVLLKRGASECSDEDSTKAMALLDAAYEKFTILATADPSPSLQYDLSIVKQRAKYCQSLRASLESRIEKLRASSHSRQAKLDAVRLQREQQHKQEQEEAIRQREERAREQEQSEKIRKELAAKFRTTEETVKAADGENSVSESEGEKKEPEDQPVRRRKRRSDAGKRRKASADSLNNPDIKESKESRDPEQDDRNELGSGDDRVTVPGKRTSSRRRGLSKETISDSDSED